jgi:hypothetical protein
MYENKGTLNFDKEEKRSIAALRQPTTAIGSQWTRRMGNVGHTGAR